MEEQLLPTMSLKILVNSLTTRHVNLTDFNYLKKIFGGSLILVHVCSNICIENFAVAQIILMQTNERLLSASCII